MPPVEIALNLNARTAADAVRWASIAQEHGASRIGVWDSPAVVPDCWTTLGVVSQHVTATPLGVTVTNPVTRHPVVTASAAATLAEVAPGGAFLGIGTGDSGVRNLGGRASTLAGLGEYVRCVRDLLARGHARWRGAEVRLDRVPDTPVPVYVSAHGTRSLELAAETGDGVIVGLGLSEDVVAGVTATVARVCDRVGRDPADLGLWWNTGSITVDTDPDRAVAAGGWLVASLAHHFTLSGTATKMIPPEHRAGIERLGAEYDLSRHGRQPVELRERYLAAAVEFGVWDYLADRFLVLGTREQVRRRLELLRARGVHRLEVGTGVAGIDGVVPVLDLVRSAGG
ncbi:LLM class flavin-dependent oxidoreductase [Actinosynnema sp. NPDC023587]|uniref:LLM class flavin-dependent oxidoreductase n=1 Tax=Actinosynnema sp. NPDC023587 TaxID=3154695 RepID=UPI0033FFDD2A